MAYYAVRRELIAGRTFGPGEQVPALVLNQLKPNVLNAMLHLGRLKFRDDEPRRPVQRKRKRGKKNGNQMDR